MFVQSSTVRSYNPKEFIVLQLTAIVKVTQHCGQSGINSCNSVELKYNKTIAVAIPSLDPQFSIIIG